MEKVRMFDSPDELKPSASVYSARLPKESEDGNLILFGEATPEYTYKDGTHPESHFSISKYLWEQAGKPESIVVFFSTEDFCAISIEAHDRISNLIREVKNDGERS